MVYCGDHGQFYCVDIAIANNKKNRRGNCMNGQDALEDVTDLSEIKNHEVREKGLIKARQPLGKHQ
jgi:hypothetical protein